MKAIGVAQISAMIEGRMSRTEVIETAAAATRQYAKRQMTWFRNRMTEWDWFEEARLSNIITSIDGEVI